MTASEHILKLVREYAHRSSYGDEPHFDEIRALGSGVLPYFIEEYPKARHWRQRASFLYRAIRYARTSPNAVALAKAALDDKSREVRYRACMLLACSLDKNALPSLEAARSHPDSRTREDICAAIDAITSENHNFFVDREHSGQVFLNFDGNHGAP